MCLRILFIIQLILTISTCLNVKKGGPRDWRTIEMLAEEHPYIVALLNHTYHYNCTGTIIGEKTILSSGFCVNNDPKFVAFGIAAVGRHINKNCVIDISYTRLHADYVFEMRSPEPNVTNMHSNIGVVIVVEPILSLYHPKAIIGNYFASELQDVKLKSVGYGKLASTYSWALQYQNYDQSPCANPKWYYCICGTENARSKVSYEGEFGNGAPVIYGSEVVAVTAATCGKLRMPANKYNIFTVIGPYLPWIRKSEKSVKLTVQSKTVRNFNPMFCINVIIYLLINYLLT